MKTLSGNWRTQGQRRLTQGFFSLRLARLRRSPRLQCAICRRGKLEAINLTGVLIIFLLLQRPEAIVYTERKRVRTAAFCRFSCPGGGWGGCFGTLAPKNEEQSGLLLPAKGKLPCKVRGRILCRYKAGCTF